MKCVVVFVNTCFRISQFQTIQTDNISKSKKNANTTTNSKINTISTNRATNNEPR